MPASPRSKTAQVVLAFTPLAMGVLGIASLALGHEEAGFLFVGAAIGAAPGSLRRA